MKVISSLTKFVQAKKLKTQVKLMDLMNCKKALARGNSVFEAAHRGKVPMRGSPESLDQPPSSLGPTCGLAGCAPEKNMWLMSHVPTDGPTEAHQEDPRASHHPQARSSGPTPEGEEIGPNAQPNKLAQQ